MTNKLFRLDIHSGKYTIIDFWGSWCGPCIEALPLLISAHNKYINNVNFVSVALDYQENIPKLKRLITENKLTWPQVWVDRHKIEGSLVFDYKVDSYPTTILLNKEGIIIYRGIGAEGLENVLKIIENKSVEN
jgi:thiol-disulfide isomerase/thioredoxin